jgi:hypothetical protein
MSKLVIHPAVLSAEPPMRLHQNLKCPFFWPGMPSQPLNYLLNQKTPTTSAA